MDYEMGRPSGYVDFDPSKYVVHYIAGQHIRMVNMEFGVTSCHCDSNWCQPDYVCFFLWIPGYQVDIDIAFSFDRVRVRGTDISMLFSKDILEAFPHVITRYNEDLEEAQSYGTLQFDFDYANPMHDMSAVLKVLREFRRLAVEIEEPSLRP